MSLSEPLTVHGLNTLLLYRLGCENIAALPAMSGPFVLLANLARFESVAESWLSLASLTQTVTLAQKKDTD